MSRASPLALAAFALALAVAPDAARSAPVAATGNGQVSLMRPFTVIKRADMDFGAWAPTGAGTAIINPVTGITTTTGAVIPVGPPGQPATFTTTGSRNSVVIVKVPTGTTTLTRVGGGATMTVRDWTLDGSSNRRIPETQTFDFRIGATLNIGAGQAEGTYTGTFAVTVNHP